MLVHSSLHTLVNYTSVKCANIPLKWLGQVLQTPSQVLTKLHYQVQQLGGGLVYTLWTTCGHASANCEVGGLPHSLLAFT